MTYDEFMKKCYLVELSKYVPDEETYIRLYKTRIELQKDDCIDFMHRLYDGRTSQITIELDKKYELDNAIFYMILREVTENFQYVYKDFNCKVKIESIGTNHNTSKIYFKHIYD